MRSAYRAVAAIAVITLLAAAVLNAQARSMARALERRQERAVRAEAARLGGTALAAAIEAVRTGGAGPPAHERVATAAGPLDVTVASVRGTAAAEQVTVRVTDAG